MLDETIPLRGDVPLIQMHLSLVEKTLRAKETAHLSAAQQQNRRRCLDTLHDYWKQGVFPKNTRHPARTPYFIDDYGINCAVGQLLVATGFESVAQKIHAENNNAYVSELNVKYPELRQWADAYGFAVDELAWIQPGYTFNCTYNNTDSVQKKNVSCYGGSDGSLTLPNPAYWGGIPPYYIDDCTILSWLDCSALSAGTYRVCIYDSAGASQTYTVTITQPDSITLLLNSTDDPRSCHGSAYASASGGTPPFSYLWSRGDTTRHLADACYGTYYITVTDANGCTKTDSIVVATLSSPPVVVTHGPIIGGVTDVSARVFVRTSEAASVTLQLSADNFATIARSVTGHTIGRRDSSNIFDIPGLSPSTHYRVRILIDGQQTGNISSFKTFPPAGQPGHYKFLFGSCQYELMDNDSALFVRMKAEDADVFTPTGDWGYPDRATGTNDLYFSNPPTSWAVDYNKVRAIYKERYASTNSAFFLRSIALDYTHDDHDYTNDNTARNAANIFNLNLEPKSVALPPQARENCLRGYREMFPGYSLPDSSEGIFHSYVFGNCEIFVLDTRSARTPQHDAIVLSGGRWTLQEPPGHTILGQPQMTWLLNGLRNSAADWKIIVSSVTFNKGYKAVLDSLLAIGKGTSPILGLDIGGTQISTGLIGAGQLSDLWVGFPSDQQMLLSFVETHEIKNVFIVSGDAHSVALDDGTNSGIPELMSANLKKANSRDPLTLSNFIGYPLWNKGASGMGNQNFNNTYGKIEVFGKDSIRLSAVDANGAEVAGYTFTYMEPVSARSLSAGDSFKIYPNPASSSIVIEARNEAMPALMAELVNAQGKTMTRKNFTSRTELNVSRLPAGIYLYRIINGDQRVVQQGKVTLAK